MAICTKVLLSMALNTATLKVTSPPIELLIQSCLKRFGWIQTAHELKKKDKQRKY